MKRNLTFNRLAIKTRSSADLESECALKMHNFTVVHNFTKMQNCDARNYCIFEQQRPLCSLLQTM